MKFSSLAQVKHSETKDREDEVTRGKITPVSFDLSESHLFILEERHPSHHDSRDNLDMFKAFCALLRSDRSAPSSSSATSRGQLTASKQKITISFAWLNG